jgi:hypothetical protein
MLGGVLHRASLWSNEHLPRQLQHPELWRNTDSNAQDRGLRVEQLAFNRGSAGLRLYKIDDRFKSL